MEMTIDKAISWLLSIAEHEGDDIPIYDEDVKAISIAIETMRKYQKIEKILKEPCIIPEGCYPKLKKIKEVIEDVAN